MLVLVAAVLAVAAAAAVSGTEPTAALRRPLCTERFHDAMDSALNRPRGSGTREGGSEDEPGAGVE